MKNIRIILGGSDFRSVDQAVQRILTAARDTGNTVLGPVPVLPKGAAKVRRLLDVTEPNAKLMPALTDLDVPSTVDISIRG